LDDGAWLAVQRLMKPSLPLCRHPFAAGVSSTASQKTKKLRHGCRSFFVRAHRSGALRRKTPGAAPPPHKPRRV